MTKTDQRPAAAIEIAVLSHADTDLVTMRKAEASLNGVALNVHCLSLQQVGSHDAMTTWLDTYGIRMQIIIVRLLGRPDGLPGLATLNERAHGNHFALITLSGTGALDPELNKLSNVRPDILHGVNAYWQAGGVDNAVQCLRYLSDKLLHTARGYKPPQRLPDHGMYFPNLPVERTLEYSQAQHNSGQPVIGILFYRAHWTSGHLNFIDTLVNTFVRRGIDVIPIFTHSLRNVDGDGFPVALRLFEQAGGIDVLVNTTAFAVADARSAVPGSASPHLDRPGVFEQFGVPVLQALISSMTREQWQQSARGLNPLDTAMNVALPEFDGRIISVPVSFKTKLESSQEGGTHYEVLPDRAERLADLAMRFACLRQTPNAHKRIAFIFTNASGNAAQIGNAVGLDAPASLMKILHAMQAHGYRIEGLPDTSDQLMQRLIHQGSYDEDFLTAEQMRAAAARVPADQYAQWFDALPAEPRRKMLDQWGAPPGAAYVDENGDLIMAGLAFGHAFVALQPPRGYQMDADAIYHQPDLAPTHHYYAFYRWLRDIWRASAIVHIGKHGTLEWLPGKGVGLSENCFPDALLADMPLFYPFIVNDPGEGSQAKRRGHAVVVDHLMPSMTTADTYGPLAELTQLIDEYYRVEALDPQKVPLLQQQIGDLIKQARLDTDLGLLRRYPHHDAHERTAPAHCADMASADFTHLLEDIDGYLCELGSAQIRDGLHTLGESPAGESFIDLICAITRLSNFDSPSLPESIAHAFEIDWPALQADKGLRLSIDTTALAAITQRPLHTHADAIEAILACARALMADFHARHFDPESIDASIAAALRRPATETLRHVLRFVATTLVPNLHRTRDEIGHLLDGLNGNHVPAGPSGAPTRGMAHVLPTGRNFYSVDPHAIPSMAAVRIGERLADEVLRRHLDEHGGYPESIGISIWGTSTMRTHGDDIAEALALLGVKPVWQAESRRVTCFTVIPLAQLGRPRIDVTVRISGFFRDAFPHLIGFVDDVIQHVAQLDEPCELNFVRKHYLDEIHCALQAPLPAETLKRRALYRIFGSKPGSYGAGILPLIQEQNWQSRDDLARAYIEWGGYAYTRDEYGVKAHDIFRARLARVDIALHNQDNREHDIFDSDDYLQFHGGMIAAIHGLTGRRPRHYFGDTHDPARPQVRDLKQEALRVFRSRVVNPKWLASIQRHGYKGGLELNATVDYLFGYDATADILDDWMYENVAQAYALNPNIQRFLTASNPWALYAMTERLLEAAQRGLWKKPADEMLGALTQLHLDTEALLEARGE